MTNSPITGIRVTAEKLWQQQAPSFNFELDEAQILQKALDVGFVTKVEGEADLYLINEHYQPKGA